jgi:hypothetical protein
MLTEIINNIRLKLPLYWNSTTASANIISWNKCSSIKPFSQQGLMVLNSIAIHHTKC